MMALTAGDLLTLDVIQTQHCEGVAHRRIRDIVSDSRQVRSGCVFVAFRGQRVDGHEYVHEVFAAGALLCVVERRWFNAHRDELAGLPLVVVRDTMRCWGEIARMYRQRFPVPLVAITGSNGKTSTKEMIAAVLETKYRVLSNEGNFNNHIGLPATLFRLRDEHQVVVTEMGTNQPGDIAWLCDIAAPTLGVVTNIGSAHLERLHSREGIAVEKGALLRALPANGTAVVNGDEPLLRQRLPQGVRRIRFGTARTAEVRVRSVTLDASGRPSVRIEAPAFVRKPVTLTLQSVGAHSAMNAAAALATGFALGCGVRAMTRALEHLAHVDRRLQITQAAGVTIINDTYNANPESMRAGIDLLRRLEVTGTRVAVLGDMRELGSSSRDEHAAVGRAVAEAGIEWVLSFGPRAASITAAARAQARYARNFRDPAALGEALCALLAPGDAVLVKGSRSMHMEDIVEYISRHLTVEEGTV
jgi:UDP-N-acetylmuramoyl-tripeptide--D-alanyl-D-alanine ligase